MPSPARRRASPSRRLLWLIAVAVLVAPLSLFAYLVRAERWSPDLLERTPMELVRYAERRLIGHPRLQSLFGPALDVARQMHEREPPPNLPTLGKGQQSHALIAAGHDPAGRPRTVAGAQPKTAAPPPTAGLNSVEALAAAMASATAGQVLELAPGSYTLSRSLATGKAGLPERPITLRAAKPGTVEFVVVSQEALRVTQPYWVFENLNWRGACPRHEDCEHAFHIAGRARGTIVLNNRTQDFNVHFKINGEDGAWPDEGLLQFNSMVNLAPRLTDLPVDVINVNGASGWQIVDNSMQRIVKGAGNRTSYGLCIKGAARQMRIERNLVVCTPERISQPGLRVGVSLGCGGSGGEYCRDGRCEVEAADSAVLNNVVAHCNDFGIDLHRASDVLVAHNTLINTAGIDARRERTRAIAVGNLLEGRLRHRDAAVLEARDNTLMRSLDLVLTAPDALDLRWNESSDGARATPETERDFCGQRRPPLSPPGATVRPRCDARWRGACDQLSAVRRV
jgi:nitrous oxidase accessory protein NosD